MVANLFFLKQFYLANKRKGIYETYKALYQASEHNKITDATFADNLMLMCETYDISVIVLDKKANIIASVKADDENFITLFNDASYMSMIENDSNNYRISIVKDPFSNNKYLELKGYLANKEFFLIRCAYIAVEDNVAVSNKFLFTVGIVGLLIGILLILLFTNKITNPILKLTEISSKMANLDFGTKYECTGSNEVDVLGENINKLSDKLESTISELKSANAELLNDIEKKDRNEEMRKEFLANVSHELKTPIALIQSYSEGLKEGIIDDAESRDYYLDVIIDESNRMNNLVKEIMTLSELEFGNERLDIERFDIVELIKNKIATASLIIKQENIDFEFRNSDESVFVWADEFKTEEVFSNYLSNAIHYCEGDKKIKVYLEKKDETVRINVFNTGKNINEEDINRIWEKFYKADKARSRDYGGSGIGLSIVSAIMRSMNTDFGCENSQDGVIFYFELPIK